MSQELKKKKKELFISLSHKVLNILINQHICCIQCYLKLHWSSRNEDHLNEQIVQKYSQATRNLHFKNFVFCFIIKQKNECYSKLLAIFRWKSIVIVKLNILKKKTELMFYNLYAQLWFDGWNWCWINVSTNSVHCDFILWETSRFCKRPVYLRQCNWNYRVTTFSTVSSRLFWL